jgi:hypothetical protein
MLNLNKALHIIEVAEPDIYEIYRSTTPVTISLSGHETQPCEAFICSIVEDDSIRLHVALQLRKNKKILVFLPDKQPKDRGGYAKTLQEAVSFAESMGFRMASVNLNFSKALREVVVRDIRVMRLSPQRKVSHKQSHGGTAHTLWAAKEKEAVLKAAAEQAETARRAAEETQVKRLTSERAGAGRHSHDGTAQTVWLAKEKETALKTAAEQAKMERHAAEVALAERLAAEEAEAERLAAEKAEAERLAAEEAEAKRIADEQAEIERRAAEEKALAERLATEKAEMERLADEKAVAERLTAEEAEAKRIADEQAEMERKAKEEALTERLATEKAEMKRLVDEKAVAERLAAEEAEAKRIADEQAEIERRAAEEKALTERLATEKAEMERLAAEKAVAERLAAEEAEAKRIADEQAEIERIAVDADPVPYQEPAAVGEPDPFAFLTRADTEPKGKTSIHADLVPSQAPTVVDELDPFAFLTTAGPETMEKSGFEPSGPAAVFSPDKSISCVEYEQTDEIVELRSALNMPRINVADEPPQKCGAYICAITRDGATRVYVALHLTESGKALVYLPDSQPTTRPEMFKVINDAMEFAETVGFMMDEVTLHADSSKRSAQLAKIPVLKLV